MPGQARERDHGWSAGQGAGHDTRRTADLTATLAVRARARATPWLGRWALAARASVAGVLAWQLSRAVLEQSQPYPAALAALLVVHPTVFRSCTAGLQYASGCALGALIALPAAFLIGPTWYALGSALLLSFLVAGHERLGTHGIHVPITCLFVLLLGQSHLRDELLPHLAAIALGVAVGIVVNLLLVPPLRLRPAEAALDRLRGELAGVLHGLATAVTEGARPEDVLDRRWRERLASVVQEARLALDQAHESLRWNPRTRARRAVWHLDRDVLATLERVAADAVAAARALDRGTSATASASPAPPPASSPSQSPPPSPPPPSRTEQPACGSSRGLPFDAGYARLLNGTALCVRGCKGGRPHPVLPATRLAWRQLAEPTGRRHGSLEAQAAEGHLLMILDRALDDLGDQGPRPAGSPHRGGHPAPGRPAPGRLGPRIAGRIAGRVPAGGRRAHRRPGGSRHGGRDGEEVMHEKPAPSATDRAHTARVRRLSLLIPVVLLAVLAVIDLSTPVWLQVGPVMAAVPVLAGALLGVWATAGIAALTLAAFALLGLVQDVWSEAEPRVTLVALVAVSLASLLCCAIRERRERELRHVRSVAETAQRALLRPLPKRIDSLGLRGTYLAAEAEARIGGDFYEGLLTPYGVRLLIGDVRGKGMPAVGAASVLLGSFREAAYQEESLVTVAQRLEESGNRQIQVVHGEEYTERFATAVLVEIPDAPIARLVHCGHPEPLIVRDGEVWECVPEKPGAPIGMADLVGVDHTVETVPFGPGDRMLLYTDGFIEARDGNGLFYPLAYRVREHATESLDSLVQCLRTDLLHHAGGDLEDDAALLVIERST
ncbi:SpoIIE family protein phosphatase [Streptomyces sp. MST-110588]|uniref:SpoIIE family protein phosphatase n=1 Tax=Streptomyces sp. MST-110588 TaxID=2833628 RepID=UPI001F5C55A0|nr:SpoIIE family protein phosphatase [Streptomyces sp. MST-110588]UNO43480.1 SpoIIE family protein phosphatase [Streptomyces sp. MST-110588]